MKSFTVSKASKELEHIDELKEKKKITQKQHDKRSLSVLRKLNKCGK